MAFPDPNAFLRYIQRGFRQPFFGPNKPEYENLLQERANRLRLKNPEEIFPTDEEYKNWESIVENLKKTLFASLPEAKTHLIKKSIAIGGVENPSAGAYTLKSIDEKFCIVITYGLMYLLHTIIKLTEASNDLSQIVYCGFAKAESISRNDIDSMAYTLFESYKRLGIPFTAPLLLTDEANVRVGIDVHAAELFVLCHEIGHFLNGDLENETLFASFDSIENVQCFSESKDHEREYAADRVGYELYLNAVQPFYQSKEEYGPILPISILFNLFELIGHCGSTSHPVPTHRTLRLAREFHGDDFARFFERTYEDTSLLRKLARQNEAARIIPFKSHFP